MRTKTFLLSSILSALLVVPAFAEDSETSAKKFDLPPSAPSEAQPYALNVVYFVPADMSPFPNYEERLSEIMLSLQRFYIDEMARHGFENRTFGLSKSADGKRVNIVTVQGKQNAVNYPYNGSAGRIINELNQFWAQNPERKFSDHTLIILPSTSGDDLNPGNVPFYGFGRNCFALDYPEYNLKHIGQKTQLGRLFTKWYGGMAHELGHGLNLPHNSGTKSAEKKFGTALMGNGNYTLGMSPTFLTEAHAVILDQCQVFRNKPLPKEPAPRVEKLEEVAISFIPEGVWVRGIVPENNRIEHVLAYYDKDEVNSVNGDYDAESFVAKFDKASRVFKVAIPYSEIHKGRTGNFQIRLRLIHDDGSCNILRYNFDEATKQDLLVPAETKLAEILPKMRE